MLVTCRSMAATVTSEFLGDAGIRAALGDQRHHLPLAGRKAVKRSRRPVAVHQARHHVGVEHRPALRDAAHRVGEDPEVPHFLLQQVADALRAVGDQGQRVRVLQELGQNQNAHAGMGGTDRQCRPQPVIRVLRRHLDVGNDHVWPVRVGQPDKVTRIGRGADDLKIPVTENTGRCPRERMTGPRRR